MWFDQMDVCVCVYVYIYIYQYVYIHHISQTKGALLHAALPLMWLDVV